jgi:hypothetical protein
MVEQVAAQRDALELRVQRWGDEHAAGRGDAHNLVKISALTA